MKHRVVLDDQLTCAQVPPEIRIRRAARRHGEKAQPKDDHKYAPRLQELDQLRGSYREEAETRS